MNTRTAAPRVRSFADGDPRAPGSPWGQAQQLKDNPLLRGVRWVSTAGHGGMGIADGIARKVLSPAAYKEGDKYGGYVWFEEDEAAVIPYYEHPDWFYLLEGRPMTDAIMASMERTIRSGFASYLRKRERGFTLPTRPRVGGSVLVLKTIPMSRGWVLNEGDVYLVKKLTADKIYLTSADGLVTFRLPTDYYTGRSSYGSDEDVIYLQAI